MSGPEDLQTLANDKKPDCDYKSLDECLKVVERTFIISSTSIIERTQSQNETDKKTPDSSSS